LKNEFLLGVKKMASYKRAGTNLYDLVDRFFNDGFSVNTPLKNIILDVQEFDDKYIIEADVPGVEKKDIHVTFNNDYLKISLEESDEIDDKATSAKTEQPPTAKTETTKTETVEDDDTTSGSSAQGTKKSDSRSEEKKSTEKSAGKSDDEKTEKKTKSTDSGSNASHYIHRERMYATVNRVVYLKGATSKGIKAELKDGVLTLIVPKREDAMNQNQTIKID